MISVAVLFVANILLGIGCHDPVDCKIVDYLKHRSTIIDSKSESECLQAIQVLTKEFHIEGLDVETIYNRALEIKDEGTLKLLFEKLAERGIPTSYFKELQNYEWYDSFESEKDPNAELKSEMLALMKKDSLFNANFHAWRRGEIELSKNDLILGAKEILDKFEDIISEYGFPSEKKSGYYFHHGKIIDTPLSILMIHIYQRGDRIYFEKLDELLCSADISQSLYNFLSSVSGLGMEAKYEDIMAQKISRTNKN